jgi:hypothetical protein
MTKIVLVNKTGCLTSLNIKSIDRENLYKKCGFRKPDGFVLKTTWDVKLKNKGSDPDKHVIELWARDFGNANTENKYDFPPPCDSVLFFGGCCLLKTDGDEIVDLEVDTWNKIYEKLFGGFEDLKSESESDDELDEVPDEMKTKDGYLKDGFVVDTNSEKSNDKSCSSDENDAEYSSDSSDDSELGEECYAYSSDGE